MKTSHIITLIGVIFLILHITIQILNFYGINQNAYGIYLIFLSFLILTFFVLPKNNPTF
jgi:hypothetical protein